MSRTEYSSMLYKCDKLYKLYKSFCITIIHIDIIML